MAKLQFSYDSELHACHGHACSIRLEKCFRRTWQVILQCLFYYFLAVVSSCIFLNYRISNANRSSRVPRVTLPQDIFVNAGKLAGAEVNRGLYYLQDVACGGNVKQFLAVLSPCAVSVFIKSISHSPFVLRLRHLQVLPSSQCLSQTSLQKHIGRNETKMESIHFAVDYLL